MSSHPSMSTSAQPRTATPPERQPPAPRRRCSPRPLPLRSLRSHHPPGCREPHGWCHLYCDAGSTQGHVVVSRRCPSRCLTRDDGHRQLTALRSRRCAEVGRGCTSAIQLGGCPNGMFAPGLERRKALATRPVKVGAMRTSRFVGLAAVALLAAGSPLLAVQQPAGAVINEDQPSAQITFIDYGGNQATCTVVNDSRHDTSAHTASVYAVIYGTDDCHYPYTYLILTVTGKDEKGVSHTASGAGYSDNFTAALDHAVS